MAIITIQPNIIVNMETGSWIIFLNWQVSS